MNKSNKSRRKFLIKAGIGTSVMIGLGVLGCEPIRRYAAGTFNEVEYSYSNKFPPKIWFEVTEKNKVILHSPKVEMGQGIFTGLAQIVADELEVDMDQMEVVHASTARGPIDTRSTGGSDTTSSLWQPLRELSATMREMLKESASKILGTPLAQLQVEKGIVSANGKSITYGEIVQQTTEWNEPKNEPQLKNVKDYKWVGKPIPRIDLKAKVLGEPIYGMDAHMPDMLYGLVVRSPKVDATFVSANTSKAETMPGVVKIVMEKDFVGVVATSRTAAIDAKKEIKVEWDTPKVWQQEDIVKLTRVGEGKAVEIQKVGKAEKILEGEDVIIAEYTSPIGAHAQIEPNGAVAFVEGEKAVIHISTQVVDITRSEVADALGLKKENVEVKTTYLGGGFGRRLHTPNAMQAALLSKAVGKPIHCFFEREEEFQNDTFRPPTHHVLKAKLKADGYIEAIEHNVSSGDVAFGSPFVPSFTETLLGADLGAWRGGMIQYEAIPNYRAVSWLVDLPFATSWWRSLGLLANTFAIESFMDELAEKVGKDPVEFRLNQTADDERGKRLKGVIKAAAEKAGWGKTLPEGRATGFACSTDVNTPVAQVVEVSIENGEIKVHKVVCAIDPGIIINPDSVRAQCEGAIIMGMSAALYEKMFVKDGVLLPTNYGQYQMALMRNAPKEIDVILLENGDSPRGVGEPPLGPIGAAIANAVYQLTGERQRNLPLEG